jgi:hypothetical protein
MNRFLIMNLEHYGSDAPVLLSVERAEEVAGRVKVDAVVVASPELAGTRADIARLRKAFGCPVVVAG